MANIIIKMSDGAGFSIPVIERSGNAPNSLATFISNINLEGSTLYERASSASNIHNFVYEHPDHRFDIVSHEGVAVRLGMVTSYNSIRIQIGPIPSYVTIADTYGAKPSYVSFTSLCLLHYTDGYVLALLDGYNIPTAVTITQTSGTTPGYFQFHPTGNQTVNISFNGKTYAQQAANILLQNLMPTDPYADIPVSGPSEPSGTYDFTSSDKIAVPALPSLSAVSTGFVSLWSPTEAQMLQLSSFMWNANPLTIEFWKKIVADPMQLIYGLNIVPLDLDALGMIDSTGEVVVGLISTGVSMNHLSGQWVELDCGTVTLDETWSAYLDYDPYTKLEIYLPYCGTHPLRVDDFMPGTIKLKYHIDLLSGACVAILTATKSNKHGDTLDSVVYQFMGNCAAQIPVTASQYADAVRSVIQLAASIGTMIAGAAGAGAAVAAETSALPASAGLAISSGAHQASAMVENVMGIKPNVERSGAIGATGGLLSVQKPYLILTRPRQARPEDQNKYTGYPSFIAETLGDLEGWTQIQAIHLEAIPCTADELTEIDELLKSGVIL